MEGGGGAHLLCDWLRLAVGGLNRGDEDVKPLEEFRLRLNLQLDGPLHWRPLPAAD